MAQIITHKRMKKNRKGKSKTMVFIAKYAQVLTGVVLVFIIGVAGILLWAADEFLDGWMKYSAFILVAIAFIPQALVTIKILEDMEISHFYSLRKQRKGREDAKETIS